MKWRLATLSVAIAISSVGQIIFSTSSAAETAAFDEQFYSSNDVLYYDPRAQACSNQTGNTSADLSNVPDPWNSLISKTAKSYPKADPRLVAATLYIENRGWPDYNKQWAVSPAGAAGPWQFIPGTWNIMGHDGNNDGKKDRNEPEDAVHAAFKHQLGSAGLPIIDGYSNNIEEGLKLQFKRDRKNLLSFMASYNGSGAPNNTPLSDFPNNENSNYVKMAYYVLASNFTQTYSPETKDGIPINSKADGGTTESTGSACPEGGDFGQVSADGFSFPVGISKANVGNNSGRWPCPQECHHDRSGAFDLFDNKSRTGTSNDSATVGKAVYAIEDGEIMGVKNSYQGENGCQTLNLIGASGWNYWYGHIQKVSVKSGQKVKAGQQVAVIGERRCTGNGSLPHLHIDRGPEKGAMGGNQGANGSKTLVPIINKLYEELQ